jgi:hypothetical protein
LPYARGQEKRGLESEGGAACGTASTGEQGGRGATRGYRGTKGVALKVRECRLCGASFQLKKGRGFGKRVFCNPECGRLAWNGLRSGALKECALVACRELFDPSRSRGDKRFHTRTCAQKTPTALKHRRRAQARARTSATGRRCKWCGRPDGARTFENSKECSPCARMRTRKPPCELCGGPVRTNIEPGCVLRNRVGPPPGVACGG